MTNLPEQNWSPGMLSVLPLFYVGWADSVLSPSEMKMIHGKIEELPFLSNSEKEQLIKWTDPSNPPKEIVFRRWIRAIGKAAKDLDLTERMSIVDLGIAIAKQGIDYKKEEIWNSPRTIQALQDLQQALGLHDRKSLSLIRNKLNVHDPVNVGLDPDFSIEEFRKRMDAPYFEVRRRMRKLLRDEEFSLTHEREKDDYRLKVLAWAKTMAGQGLGAYAFPVEYGGRNDAGSHITVFEMLGYHDMSLAVKFGVQFGLYGGAVYNLGTKRHHDLYLKGVGTADILGCFAMTETGHGSNVKGLETTAVYQHDTKEIIINTPHDQASKEYIGNALHADYAVVFAQLIVQNVNHGVHAIIVPMRNSASKLLPGIRVEDCGYKMGLNGVDNGRIWFDEVRVPVDNLLNRFANIDQNGIYKSPIANDTKRFFVMLGTLVAGRVCVAWASVSGAKKALSIAVKYGLKRRQFALRDNEDETLIMDYPSHQRRLIPKLVTTFAIDFAMKELTELYVKHLHDEDKQKVDSFAAGLKAYATWHATKTIQTCRECCGGKGYLVENQFADLKADTDIFTTFEGDNTVLHQLVAKGLLSDFRKEFYDEGYLSVMRYITGKISTSITERNPYNIRRTDTAHLTDPAFLYDAFRYRFHKLRDGVAQRMRRYIAKKIHPSDAFLRCQNHMIELSEAYIEFRILKSMYKAVASTEDESVKKMMHKLYVAYGLCTLEQNKGWFLEADYMTGSKTKAIRRLVDKYCADLREDLPALVEVFNIPEELIKAPIVV